MDLSTYRPTPALVTRQTPVSRPCCPVIDAHNHLGGVFGGEWDQRPLQELLDEMDSAGVKRLVDLDGGWGEAILQDHLDKFKSKAPERFAHFAGVEWPAWKEQGDGFGDWAAKRLREQVRWGAQGLKIWKPLGLSVRDPQGNLAAVDDARLDPIWCTAAELNIPVTIHIADPVAFFQPLDERNERFEELNAHPDWHFLSPPFPAFLSIVEQMARLVERHPKTVFIGAHVGCYAEDLGWVSRLLDRCPNFNIDISARIAELGRQPYTSRRFFLKYADRILFGTDMAVSPAEFRIHYRFLETDDEYFAYSTSSNPPQGRWNIYGLYLPKDVLEQVYYRNAERLIFGDASKKNEDGNAA